MFCDVVPGENPELEKYTNAEEFSCKVSNAHKSIASIERALKALNCTHSQRYGRVLCILHRVYVLINEYDFGCNHGHNAPSAFTH